MDIISHRGFWIDRTEANTHKAFERAIHNGYGIETDFRDSLGKIVIAHDMAQQADESFCRFLDLVEHTALPLALNIKSDGLASIMGSALKERKLKNWFMFDMSIPDMRAHLAAGNRVFSRLSEVETDIPWPDNIQGIWLDAFEREWFDEATIASLLEKYAVCVVSPELHGRANNACWSMLRPLASHPNLSLCTDLPADAERFFQ